MTFGVGGMVAITLLQAGLCYLIAKWFLEGKGTFVEVVRPLMLVWFVNCLALISRKWGLLWRGCLDNSSDDGI
jgi:hypothetical protein